MKKISSQCSKPSESSGWWNQGGERLSEWTFEGRPEPELLSTKYGLTASATVTSAAYMLVYEKWTICQFEWHRDNKNLLPSQRTTKALFLRRIFIYPTHSFSQTRCGESAQ